MTIHRPLRDEQARGDLLVGQALRDQACYLGFALAQRAGVDVRAGRGIGVGVGLVRAVAERQPDRRLPPEALPGVERLFEPGRTEPGDRRLLRRERVEEIAATAAKTNQQKSGDRPPGP